MLQLHAKYQHAGRHKRNLIITGGVTASILVAPILAGIAVGQYHYHQERHWWTSGERW